MNDAVNLEKLLISNPYGSKNEFESVATFEESDPYIRWLSIDFALEKRSRFVKRLHLWRGGKG